MEIVAVQSGLHEWHAYLTVVSVDSAIPVE